MITAKMENLAPWQDAGIILDSNIPVKTAQIDAGLSWGVRKEKAIFMDGDVPKVILDAHVMVRNDTNNPIGVVGNRYTPYTNDEMFAFIDRHLAHENATIERSGTLKGGKTVWVLAKTETQEYINNDPIGKYLLFKNSFDGTSSLEVCFTDIRIACANAFSYAFAKAKNAWAVRHTSSVHEQMIQVENAIALHKQNNQQMQEAMKHLANIKLSSSEVGQLATMIAHSHKMPYAKLYTERNNLNADASTRQLNVIHELMNLHETGLGSDIVGVRGTAYGMLQAATEYADHYKSIKVGSRDKAESYFQSSFMGSGLAFKQRAFNVLLQYAA